MSLVDQAARVRAMTDLDASMLVEAGAGSGKTSVMAARVVKMLAAGVAPKNIAAVTFTEKAASELLGRIGRFVEDAANLVLRAEFAAAFAPAPTAQEIANLKAARDRLGELTATTIHGFCQRLIKPYPVEANIDPGARLLDPAEVDLMFEDLFDRWIRRKLSGGAGGGLVADIVAAEPDKGLETVREIARLLRRHRDAVVGDPGFSRADFADLRVAVTAFRAFSTDAAPTSRPWRRSPRASRTCWPNSTQRRLRPRCWRSP